MEFKSTAAAIDRELQNHRTDDPYQKAAVRGALAIVGEQTYSNEEELKVTLEASEDSIVVVVAKA
jgi:hypothetical protein